ncbi:MAG: hypothetical protein JNM39_01030 [Bdellovibrionaceae bacterium]|nr:hypothetical protein [Pseudobdellovibrionaceae bacterium]
MQVNEEGMFSPDQAFPIEISLAALIMIFCVPKIESQLAKLESHLRPEWITDDFRLYIQVIGQSVSFNSSFKLTQLNELQSYWALMDLGRKKSPLDPELLALHILENFSFQTWEIQKAAFFAILERLQSAKNEKLELLPHSEGFLHAYHVFRKSKKNILPYGVTFFISSRFSGSCTCKDFLKNRLSLCKHLASGLLQFKSAKSKKILPSISWKPNSEKSPNLTNEIFATGFL